MKTVMWEPGVTVREDAVVSIGVFDGVHLGHQALITSAAAEAHELGVACVAVTFDRDPDQVLTPDRAVPQLLSLADKCRFLEEAGADCVLVIPFDADLALLSPSLFLERVLLKAMRPRAVHVGVDFRFGRYAEGTVDSLVSAGRRAEFVVRAHELVTHDGVAITSTYIRGLVAAGEVQHAAVLLGRDHRVCGTVVKGRGAGLRDLGFPTANLLPTEHAALPADGVYAGWALLDETMYPAALSVGLPPTFPEAHDSLEAHILDLDADLYSAALTVGFSRRLRPQQRFDSTADLSAAIEADIADVRGSFSGASPR